MYARAPARLAAAHRACRRDLAALRSRIAAERIFRQRKCAEARRLRDRGGINFHCK
jgi:hypothetical protein